MSKIKIIKIPGAFMAVCDGVAGVGNTWMEAIGALVACAPERFGVVAISYDMTNAHTRGHVIEQGLNEHIGK